MIFSAGCKVAALCLSALVAVGGFCFSGPKYKNCVVMRVGRSIENGELKLDCTITKYDVKGNVAKMYNDVDELVDHSLHFDHVCLCDYADPDCVGEWRRCAYEMAADSTQKVVVENIWGLCDIDEWGYSYNEDKLPSKLCQKDSVKLESGAAVSVVATKPSVSDHVVITTDAAPAKKSSSSTSNSNTSNSNNSQFWSGCSNNGNQFGRGSQNNNEQFGNRGYSGRPNNNSRLGNNHDSWNNNQPGENRFGGSQNGFGTNNYSGSDSYGSFESRKTTGVSEQVSTVGSIKKKLSKLAPSYEPVECFHFGGW